MLAIALAVLESKTLIGGWGMPPLTVFRDGNNSRNVLGLLWQVEGSILALVTAVVLFAFEGLTRSRPAISIWEYARRSGLAQYLMLGGAGLTAIPVALFWRSTTPPIVAAHFAAAIAVSGIVALPLLVYRAMRIIDASWLRGQRLNEVDLTVRDIVRQEAIERMASRGLEKVAAEAGFDVRGVFFRSVGSPQFRALEASTVYDIHLGRLASFAKATASSVSLLVRIGDQVAAGRPLLATQGTESIIPSKSIAVLTPRSENGGIGRLLGQLKEEGIEALRSESSAGMAEVVDSYTHLWLAWPHAWAQYGQRLSGRFLDRANFFQLTPMHDLQRDVWALLDAAIERGLREQARALAGIVYRVGVEAIDVDAPDILRGACSLAVSSLHFPRNAGRDLHEVINGTLCRFLVELCNYRIFPRFEDPELSLEGKERAAESGRVVFRAIGESLRRLLENRDDKLFDEIDREFSGIISNWGIDLDVELATSFLDDADSRESASYLEEQEPEVIATAQLRRDLAALQMTLRMSLLGWGLHLGAKSPLDEGFQHVLLRMARTFNDLERVVPAVGVALEGGRGPLSDWVLSSLPSGEAHFIDDQGPLLHAFALILLISPSGGAVPPAGWMTEERINRTKSFIDDLAGDSIIGLAGLVQEQRLAAASRASQGLDAARLVQVRIEHERLVRRSLDPEKIQSFKNDVLEAWSAQRVLPGFADLCRVPVNSLVAENWTGSKFGYYCQLHHKGLFVTPSNWVGLDHLAKDLGGSLARSEVGALVLEVCRNASKIRGRGRAVERLRQAIESLQDVGYHPSVIIAPVDRQLAGSLGLSMRYWARNHATPLGRYVSGELFGLPVVQWHEISKDRLYVADMARLLTVEEGVNLDGESVAPECEVETIDEALAVEIVRRWGRKGPGERMGEDELQGYVRVTVERPLQIHVADAQAARSVWIPRQKRTGAG
ncbi:hypothetical protein [Micromonospora sp. WMMD998]|uniref:hypothetical protein n=1 Tax=Micromonospora sp. WMMD998 TaxID=3016092 RepID=UPI00249C0125|nr:hypothetical protein [Micromonospora sp. WMMD998]WFE41614.1 hypothetical protein O7619_25420 [Micromonospora sp. WMMD998]